MPKTKSITKPEEKLVNHGELRVLVAHISALVTALEVRVMECERVLAVDPLVGELAADFLKRVKGEHGEVLRTLALVDDEPAEAPA